MGWAVAAPAIATTLAATLSAKASTSNSKTAVEATNAASAAALAEEKRIFDLQRQDELQARARRLAVAGNNRQVLLGDDGKMTLAAPNKTLADYSVSGITPAQSQTLSANGLSDQGTSLGGFAGDGNKMNTDAQDTGMSAPNDPTVTMMNPFGAKQNVPTSRVPQMQQQGWMLAQNQTPLAQFGGR